MPLDPDGRILRAKTGAFTMHSRHSIEATTAAGLAAANDRFVKQVDPDLVLPEGERMRRAAAARQAWMTKLSFRARQARMAKAAGETG